MTNRILFKVYTVWFLRRILPLIIAQVLFLVLVLRILASKIFFGRVLENAASAAGSSYWEFSRYLFGAFFQTSFKIQLVILLALGIGALVLRDLGRAGINYVRTFKK